MTLQEALDGDRRAQRALKDVATGYAPLTEAITTADFPGLFQKATNATVEAKYTETPPLWREWAKPHLMNGLKKEDFIDLGALFDNLPKENGGAVTLQGGLPRIPEGTPFPAIGFQGSEKDVWTYKYGARLAFTWEAFANDDWSVIESLPEAMVQQARRTETLSATSVLFDMTNGWKSAVFGTGVSTSDAPLTFENLIAALADVSSSNDPQRVNTITRWALIVPRALTDVAETIVSAIQVERSLPGTNDKLIVPNRVGNRVVVVENPYLGVMPGSGYANLDTSWALVPYQGNGSDRTAIVQTFLRGKESPELRIKNDQGNALGGGNLSPYEGSFDTDDIQIRVRHFTNTVALNVDLGFYASNGSGS